jgi:hypothetical protein
MGKRSDFTRRKNDMYDTPEGAVIPLLPHLDADLPFIEPCAGRGKLASALYLLGPRCIGNYDIRFEPSTDARIATYTRDQRFVFITNPPWTRLILHPIIENLRKQAPTWLLLDADWMHTKQAAPYLEYCSKIVSVGRVKWIPDSKHTGKDNCAWYLFEASRSIGTEFYGAKI